MSLVFLKEELSIDCLSEDIGMGELRFTPSFHLISFVPLGPPGEARK